MSKRYAHMVATVGLGVIGAIAFALLVLTGLVPEYTRCQLICIREWAVNTPHLWFPLLGAVGAIARIVFESSKGKPPTSSWAFAAFTLIGSCSGFLSFFLVQSITGNTSIVPTNLPLSYIVAVAAGYVGEAFYDRIVERGWSEATRDEQKVDEVKGEKEKKERDER
jgi:hypothetical protein